jgi:hypothetical protein
VTEAFPSAGGNIAIPALADVTGTVNLPANNAAAGEMLTFMLSQTPFVDTGGNGPIPAPPAGQTAILYSASYLTTPQTIGFTPQTGAGAVITVTASAPCEILTGHTYVAYVYANGSGFPHSEISQASGYPVTLTTSGTVVSGSFQINLAGDLNEEPQGVGLEVVFAQTS